MNPQEDTVNKDDIYKTWKFIYNDSGYPKMPQYPKWILHQSNYKGNICISYWNKAYRRRR
jgi:hypothetical protein